MAELLIVVPLAILFGFFLYGWFDSYRALRHFKIKNYESQLDGLRDTVNYHSSLLLRSVEPKKKRGRPRKIK